MTLQERFAKQVEEVNILRERFEVTSPDLNAAVASFKALWADSRSTNEQLEEAADVIEGHLEDACIAHRISQESIEEHIDPRLICA